MTEPQIRYPSRVFEHPNMSGGFVCPVCKCGADDPVVLAPIPGTQHDNIVECKQVHAKCWEVIDLVRQIEETRATVAAHLEEPWQSPLNT